MGTSPYAFEGRTFDGNPASRQPPESDPGNDGQPSKPKTSSRLRPKQSLAPLILSMFAVVMAAGSLGWSVYQNPPVKGLRKYDLSTPKAALEATVQMISNGDYQALAEYSAVKKMSPSKAKELVRTLKIKKELEWRGKKILFFQFERNGAVERSTAVFEKDASTGYWLPGDGPGLTFSPDEEEKSLQEKMRTWKESGGLP